jgi:hypothetical protein
VSGGNVQRNRRRLGLGRATQARLGWWTGWLVACAGVFLAFGLPVALMVFGLVVAATFVTLHPVDEPDNGEEVRLR